MEKVFENFKLIWLFFISKTWYRRKKIRVSISYLFKIKLNDTYLLVRGKRIPNQFQPVGGVYKRYRESYYALEKLKVTDDDNIPIDDKSIDDLRIKLPAKNVISFLKWYNSQLGREVSPYREFYEEVIRTGILNQATFPYANYIHKGRHMTPIHFSKHFQCYEILIAEVFELKPNDDQLNELKTLLQKDSAEYIWAREELILRRGVIPGKNSSFTISETSEWIL
ncbi:MAG TPA: hypothetical protein VGQ09_21320 [Chitinophagaceae bacterium]|nr:hypothetical protein [Chitinophagaceae bacterium]